MKNTLMIPRQVAGFTLVEMAMVLMIVGLLLAGLIPTLSAQMESQRINETRKQIDEIQQALVGYAIIKGRLPCPADGTIPTGQTNAGIEKPTCVTGSNGGILPWVTLGISETDAWGRRFTYRVTPAFADSGTSFQLSSPGNLNVGLTADIADSSVASNVPIVVVSHGMNGLGAYTPAGGSPIPNATGYEGDNADNSNNHFVSRTPSPTFDDLVVWISPNTLANRMVAAGKLP